MVIFNQERKKARDMLSFNDSINPLSYIFDIMVRSNRE